MSSFAAAALSSPFARATIDTSRTPGSAAAGTEIVTVPLRRSCGKARPRVLKSIRAHSMGMPPMAMVCCCASVLRFSTTIAKTA